MEKFIKNYPNKDNNSDSNLPQERNVIMACESFLNRIGQRHTLFSHKDGILNFVSNGITNIAQKEPKEVIGQAFKDILHWTDETLNLQFEQVEKIMQGEIDYIEFDMDFYDSKSTLRTLHVIQYARYDKDGNIVSIDGLAEDITYRKNIENKNIYLENIINEFAVYVKTDPTGIILDASDSFYREFKGNKDFFNGKKINIIQSGRTSDSHYQKLWKAIQAGNIFEHEIQNSNLEREKHWYHVKILPQLNSKSNIIGYLAFYHNIDDKVQLKKEAHSDPLTELTNRQYLQDIHSQINLREYDVIMIDVDHFKRINDTYGHHIGDRALKKIARTLQKQMRNDDILIRYGGEEFLCLMHNSKKDINITKEFSERIRMNVQKAKIEYRDILIKLTVSIGVEGHTERTRNLEEAILHADEMMYFAKRRGRNRIEIYDEVKSLKSRSNKNKYTISEVKEALEKDRLVCHYQPIVNKEREIVKYESLVRLIDKNGKLMMPDTFLPFIKNTNIYIDMTKQVMNYNFMFFKSRSECFTFNLSFSDLLNESIINIIMRKINDYPEISKRLTIELLEDEMIDDFEAVQDVMQKLRQKGIKFSIDDFGSGYANFGNIFKLDFDYLKINGELIRNINKSEYSRNMVESLSDFAKKAQVKIIAEYIESEQIFDTVKKYDIDLYQGYYIGKPSLKLL